MVLVFPPAIVPNMVQLDLGGFPLEPEFLDYHSPADGAEEKTKVPELLFFWLLLGFMWLEWLSITFFDS